MKRIVFVLILILGISSFFIAQENRSKITALSEEDLRNSNVIPGILTVDNEKVMACAGNVANDNFANAQSLTVNGGTVTGSTCGTLESGETTGCFSGANQSVWYKFVATATSHYVQVSYAFGGCYLGSAIYGNSTLPNSSCGNSGPISCQSASGGPFVDLYYLTNLTIGKTYYIQVLYSSGGVCGSNAGFLVQVTTANPGGTITNPPSLATCTSPGAACFFNSPPAVGTVTAGCTSYPLAASGYSANSVWSTVLQFTSSASWSNFSWQAIITSNCLGGNVVWLNWTLYDCSCNQLACGNISTLTGNGLACGTCYRLKYEMELANCSSFTTIWPYQNVPSSPTPCTILPLNLLYFTAHPMEEKKKVNIEWTSISESHLKAYLIQRSDDGINFNLLASVNAKGNSNSEQKYNYEDECCIGQQTRYYKLIAIDEDGSVSFEKIIAVTFKNNKEITKFSPNPAKDNFVITFGEDAQKAQTTVQIYNSLGQIVKEESFFTETFFKQINIEDFTPGIYFVNLITPASSEVIKYKLVKE